MIRPIPDTPQGLRGELQDLRMRHRFEMHRIATEATTEKDRALRRLSLLPLNWRILECEQRLKRMEARPNANQQ